MEPTLLRLAFSLTLVAAFALACGDDTSSGEYLFGPDWEEPRDSAARDAGAGAGPDASADTSTPEEPEERQKSNQPTATRRFVFVANRSLDSVAKIDVDTLAVTPIPVGREPTIIRTAPTGDVAVVLNSASDTVSIITANPDRDEVATVDVIRGCNQLSMAPSGSHVVAWYDNLSASVGDRIGSLQEVSVVALASGASHDVSVGFNIRAVEFDTAGGTAFVVTDTGISPVDLASLDGDVAVPSVDFGDDPLVNDADREVALTASGAYAVLRSSSFEGVRVVDMATEEAVSVALPGVPTDVDLLADDASALVAIRDAGLMAVLRFADVLADPSDVELVTLDVPVGLVTLTPDESFALTYSTVGGERRMGVVTLDGGARARTITLSKTLRAVLAAPDGATALIVHASEPGTPVAGEPIDDFVAKSEGVSLFDLASGYAKLVTLSVAPEDIVFTPEGRYAFLMLADESTRSREIVLLDFDTFASRSFAMDFTPESMGLVPGSDRLFVSQDVAGGRITFIDAGDGTVRHVSAFHLNAYID